MVVISKQETAVNGKQKADINFYILNDNQEKPLTIDYDIADSLKLLASLHFNIDLKDCLLNATPFCCKFFGQAFYKKHLPKESGPMIVEMAFIIDTLGVKKFNEIARSGSKVQKKALVRSKRAKHLSFIKKTGY